MIDGDLPFDLHDIPRADTNSLLRMYDLANGIRNRATLQLVRMKADRAIQRITRALQKKNVRP